MSSKKIEKYVDGGKGDLHFSRGLEQFTVTDVPAEEGNNWYYCLAYHNWTTKAKDFQYFITREGLAEAMKAISGDMRKWRVRKYA